MSAIAKTARAPDYSYWSNALDGTFGAVHDGDPQPGFYRKRTGKAAGYVPVAIWEQDGKIVALVDGKEADAVVIWTFVCQYPISEEWYRARHELGLPWPDESAAVTASLAPPPSGHNNPPTDAAEILQGSIDAALAGVDEYSEIKDDETAAKAQSLRSRLLELSGDADKKREAEKRPHLDASTAIDKKWQPLVKMAKAGADAIRAALGAHETSKAKEAARLAAIEEEKRIKAQREAVKLAAAGKVSEPVPMPAPPAPAPAPVTAIRGAYGRAAAVKIVKVATVKDLDAAYGFLKTHKELVDLIGQLAQRAITAGYTVPGVEVTEERKVS